MGKTSRLLSAVALLFFAKAAVALQPDRAISQYAHRAWRIEDGLPNSVVRGIVQTDDGYLWIATYDGLARFNGDTFTRFDKTTLPGLRRDTILAFHKSRDGTLWIGTNGGGLGIYSQGTLRSYSVREGLPSDTVTAFGEMPDGTMWIGTSGGLCKYRGGKLERVSLSGFAPAAAYTLAIEYTAETLWVGTRGGGLIAFRDGKAVRAYTVADGLANDGVFSLRADRDGSLWIGTSKGLNRMKDGLITKVSGIPEDQLTSILRDSDGVLWIGAYSLGLFRSSDDQHFVNYSSVHGLLNNSVRTLFEDSEKNFWVGTNGGLERFTQGRFITVGAAEGLQDSYARSVFQDRAGDVWIGTAHGLYRFGPDGKATIVTSKDGLTNDYIFAIAQAPDGAMWVGTPTGLNRIAEGHVDRFDEKSGLVSPSVRALFFDRDGVLWIGSDRGLNWYRDGKIERPPLEGWDNLFVQAFAEDHEGGVWVGSDGRGLAHWSHGAFIRVTDRDGLPDTHVLSLVEGSDRALWIGTDSAGLIRMKDGKFARFTTASGLQGDKVLQLLDDGKRLWFGGGRGIWSVDHAEMDAFASGRIKSVHPTVFGYGDGMRSVQCNGSVYPSGFRTRDGRLWFPTVDGVATVWPDAPLHLNKRPPPLKIESVVVDGRTMVSPSELNIEPGTKQIEIHYAALTYSLPERVGFRYRLEGFDSDWVEAGNRRVAYYTNVPPGTYSFRVIAANSDGVWNRTGASLPLKLKPRFVQTIWFPILILILVLSTVWFIQQRRVYVMRKREQELVEIVADRTREIQSALHEAEEARRKAEGQEEMLVKALDEAEAANRAKSIFLANISHELRTPLNAIIGFSEVLEMSGEKSMSDRQRKFIHNISTSGEHLLSLINDILDLAKVEAGQMTMETEQVSLLEVFDAVVRVMRGLTLARSIALEIDATHDIGSLIADPIKLKQVIYNLVSNAVKFSPDGSTIRIVARRLTADKSPLGQAAVSIAVVDRGIGIALEHQELIFEEFRQVQHPSMKRAAGTGLGLALVKKLVAMHGGLVKVESAIGEGSTFTVILPAVPAMLVTAQQTENIVRLLRD